MSVDAGANNCIISDADEEVIDVEDRCQTGFLSTVGADKVTQFHPTSLSFEPKSCLLWSEKRYG